MKVEEGMSRVALVVGPSHTVRSAAELMAQRGVGAAVVMIPDSSGPAIITERDIVRALGGGEDPDTMRVGDHMSSEVVLAQPDWSLEEAAVTMVRCGFRHLIVIDRGEIAGVLSMRDIVRCWTDDGAICELPAGVTEQLRDESRSLSSTG